MKKYTYIQRAFFAALLVLGMQVVYAAFSFTGLADERNKSNKYSLKNLSALSHKSLSFTSLKLGLQYKGQQQPSSTKETANGVEMSSMLRYDNGSTTLIVPYKFKVKTSKFKTPAPQH
jgi:predicted porin